MELRKIFQPFTNPKIDQWQLFTDLISILTIIAGIFYMGGFVYTKAYFEKFFLNPNTISSNIAYYVTTFVDQVILSSLTASFIALLIVLIFATLFYLSRVSTSWWGYLTLCTSLILLFFITTFLAEKKGHWNADRDWLEEYTHLPKVTIMLEEGVFDPRLVQMGEQSLLRLIYETDAYIYLFQPRKRGDQSDLPVYIIPKESISQLNIFNVRRR